MYVDEPSAPAAGRTDGGGRPEARRDFWNEIHALAADGLTVLVSTHYMDEAERCHELAYIAYGELLVRGTVGDVVEGSRLTTWIVTAPNVTALTSLSVLGHTAGVDMVAPFGTSLHVSGRNAKELDAATAQFRLQGLEWKRAQPSLEDVFIDLMGRAKDNYQ